MDTLPARRGRTLAEVQPRRVLGWTRRVGLNDGKAVPASKSFGSSEVAGSPMVSGNWKNRSRYSSPAPCAELLI